MSAHQLAVVDPGRSRDSSGRPVGGLAVGCFYLTMAGVHLGIVASDPETYRAFADHGLFAFVRDGWRDIVMLDPGVWGSLLMAGELAIGVMLVAGGRWARYGWAAVIVFHVLLMFFGWWVWAWSVPALALALTLARHDLARGGRR